MSEQLKPRLEVCPSPAMLPLYDVSSSVVVIIDVLRATSTICTALYNGAEQVIPVASVAECIRTGQALKAITAGERDGFIAEGLRYGNSPFEYPREFVAGKTVVLTTTNGTRLLHMASGAAIIITGSFPNLSEVCSYLVGQSLGVVLGCAAWKDRVNLEDMLFAGAVVNRVRGHFHVDCDAALIAETLYLQARHDLFGAMKKATHYHRLAGYGMEKDIRYCLTADIAPSLPLLENGALVNRSTVVAATGR
jgi:2-phosphosulfolactate phosphatase